jgi:hypothetical protein
MEKAVAIKTPVGNFNNYRDNIILKNIEWNCSKTTFYLNISKNGIENNRMDILDEYNFKITFYGIISLFHVEYDTYEGIINNNIKPNDNVSAFEIIEGSNYIKNLPIRNDRKDKIKHYYLSTYDDVFNILAEGYIFELL